MLFTSLIKKKEDQNKTITEIFGEISVQVGSPKSNWHTGQSSPQELDSKPIMAAVLAGKSILTCAVAHQVVKVIDSQVSPPLLILHEPLCILEFGLTLYLLYRTFIQGVLIP